MSTISKQINNTEKGEEQVMADIDITGKLPEGNTGLASKYPGDVGIENDSAVIFADDFEDYTIITDIGARYDNFFNYETIYIVDNPDIAYSGNKSIEFRMPVRNNELSLGVVKNIEEKDVLFVRYYAKYAETFDIIGSSHNGITLGAHYEDAQGRATPGIPADGYNKFLVALEYWRGDENIEPPGELNVYVYHPEQRDNYGDHFFPTGTVLPFSYRPGDFETDFVSRPDFIPELGRWYCYELMVKANTPGQRDGRIAFWVDGALTADFGNIRFREIDSIKIDKFTFGFHAGRNPNAETSVWYDNIVIAESYIGPIMRD
jgi:hypothetical protein